MQLHGKSGMISVIPATTARATWPGICDILDSLQTLYFVAVLEGDKPAVFTDEHKLFEFLDTSDDVLCVVVPTEFHKAVKSKWTLAHMVPASMAVN